MLPGRFSRSTSNGFAMDARLVDHTISRNDSAPLLRALLEVTERGLVKGTWGPSVCHLRTLCDVFRPSLFPGAERVSSSRALHPAGLDGRTKHALALFGVAGKVDPSRPKRPQEHQNK